MKFLKELLSEKSTVSCVRAMSLLCVIIAGCIAGYGIHESRDLIGVAALVSAFITPAFTAKVIQKKFENDEPTDK